MTRTQIYLPKTQIDVLRKLARRKNLSMSEVIRSIIRERFQEGLTSLPTKSETLLIAARRINKLGKKGPKDLAANLDKYLYGRE